MKKILLYLFIWIPVLAFTQAPANYNITVNTNNTWQANLFFQRGGTQPRPVMIVDPTGTQIFSQNWGMKGWDFKVNYNNKLSYFDRQSKGWFIMDSLQNEIDSVYMQNGYIADNHDFLALPNGNYVLFAYDEQPYAMDTIVAGGDPNAIVEGLIIQELDPNHNVIFEWKSWDHFHVTDNIYLSPWTSSNLAFIHANAIDIDFDGHFLISSRGLDEITKIHRTTGEIIWRWGGSQTDITFANDYPFTHQHSIRSLGNNRYLLYDNGNYSGQYYPSGNNVSRAVEYELDTNLMEVTKVWEFIHPDSLYTPSIGGVQRLPNGNTLINFGNLQALNIGSIVTEVDTNNQIVFQLEYDNGGNLYRAQKFDWFFYTPTNPTLGCTDSLACNYNPLATVDDSSCVYLNIIVSSSNVSCNGSVDGSITATATGGALPFQYSLGGGLSQTSGTFTNLTAGLYYIDVTDVNGCTSNETITITEPDSLIISVDSTDETAALNDGSATAFVLGGTPAYTYIWNTIPPQITNPATNLAPGLYHVTVSDANGCAISGTTSVNAYNPTGIINIKNTSKVLIKITDVLGQETLYRKNTPLLYIYDDGTVQKKIIIE